MVQRGLQHRQNAVRSSPATPGSFGIGCGVAHSLFAAWPGAEARGRCSNLGVPFPEPCRDERQHVLAAKVGQDEGIDARLGFFDRLAPGGAKPDEVIDDRIPNAIGAGGRPLRLRESNKPFPRPGLRVRVADRQHAIRV
jgi:hypothetical protein